MGNFNIYQRLLKITEELKTVEKNLNVQVTSKSSYKAVSERDVLDAVKPLEAKYGVYSYAFDRNVIDSGVLTSTRTYNNIETEVKQFYLRLEVTYRFVNVDNPTEYIDIKSYGDGIDTGDKATGKAMTYADKYALLKAYKISTGDDPDQEASGELKAYKDDKASDKQIAMLKKYYTGEGLKKLLDFNRITKLEDMPKETASNIISKIIKANKQQAELDGCVREIENEDAGDRI